MLNRYDHKQTTVSTVGLLVQVRAADVAFSAVVVPLATDVARDLTCHGVIRCS